MKKKKEIKPFYPLHHEYQDSLQRYLEATGLLYSSITTLRSFLNRKVPEEVLQILDRDIKRYEEARVGDDS